MDFSLVINCNWRAITNLDWPELEKSYLTILYKYECIHRYQFLLYYFFAFEDSNILDWVSLIRTPTPVTGTVKHMDYVWGIQYCRYRIKCNANCNMSRQKRKWFLFFLIKFYLRGIATTIVKYLIVLYIFISYTIVCWIAAMEKADPHNVRLLLLGDSKVGKTSLRLRLFSYFTDEYYPR